MASAGCDADLERYGLDGLEYALLQLPGGGAAVAPPPRAKVDAPPSRRLPRGGKGKAAPAEEDSEDGANWCVYCLVSVDKKKTHVGVTRNLERRLRQHNGELVRGAKSTVSGRPWSVACTVRGFETRSQAFQLEWRWKNPEALVLPPPEGGGGAAGGGHAAALHTASISKRHAELAWTLTQFPEWKPLQVNWML